jgi:hypothetical protein
MSARNPFAAHWASMAEPVVQAEELLAAPPLSELQGFAHPLDKLSKPYRQEPYYAPCIFDE